MLWVIGSKGLVGSTICRKIKCIGSSRKEADIGDLEALRAFALRHPEIEGIINTAAFTQVDAAEERQEEAYLINAIGAQNVATIARELGARMVHLSTDYVFPGTGDHLLSEEDAVEPVNFYGKTKLEGERRLLDALPSACIIRTSAIFGSSGKNFASRLFSLMQEKEEIVLTNDQISSPTFVEDLANAAVEMFPFSGIYHFANQGTASKYTFGLELKKQMVRMGYPLKVQKIASVPSSYFQACCPRPKYSAFDTSKIQKFLSFPILGWEERLKRSLSDA